MRIQHIRLFTLLGFLTYFQLLQAQDFYDPATIQEIKITFDFTNWDSRMDTAIAATESYTIAKTVEINGVIFDSVGVKYKGNSSYKPNNAKNPLHIELDHIIGNQAYNGYTDMKLGNGFSDPTFIREAVSYWVLGHYMHCPRSNFAKVYINGQYYGLMSNVENIGKSFLSDHFYSSKGPFFKCNPVGGAGPGSTASPNLKWLGADTTLYKSAYELKSDVGFRDLTYFIDTLNNKAADVDKILDVDRALWMLAFNDLLVNLDSYTGAFTQNYYLYRGENRRFNPIVWDLNMSFGAFPMLNSGGGGGLDSTAMKNLSPLILSTSTTRPLIKNLLQNATYKRMYLAHIRTMLHEMFVSGDYLDKALEQQAIIDPAVLADNNKFYTYAQFKTNLNWGVGGGGGGGFGSVPGITSLMNGRISYLNGTPEISAVPPEISNVTHAPNPQLDSEVWVTAKVTGTTNTVLMGWRGQAADIFTRVTMFDDGQHQDGAAGDGVYGASFIASTPLTQCYVYAENDNAGAFLPARAEHEFFTIQTILPVPDIGAVVINEILADNTGGSADPAGEREDWLELFNNTSSPINLTGLYLSDNKSNLQKWAIPAGTIIPAQGYVVVWADEDGTQGGLHANFKFKASGESLILSATNGTILDSISFGAQLPDRSFGRYVNGTGAFVAMPPSIGEKNTLTSGIKTLAIVPVTVQITPNPVHHEVKITVPMALNEAQLVIYDPLGRIIMRQQFDQFKEMHWSVANYPSGTYTVAIFSKEKNGATLMVVER